VKEVQQDLVQLENNKQVQEIILKIKGTEDIYIGVFYDGTNEDEIIRLFDDEDRVTKDDYCLIYYILLGYNKKLARVPAGTWLTWDVAEKYDIEYYEEEQLEKYFKIINE
jgi:hypothetical protein